MRFAKDLETITHAEHFTAFLGEFDHTLHHWAEPGNGAAAHIIAVGEATGQYDAIFGGKHTEVLLFMPKHYNFLIQIILQGILHIAITIGTRKNYNTKFHLKMFICFKPDGVF